MPSAICQSTRSRNAFSSTAPFLNGVTSAVNEPRKARLGGHDTGPWRGSAASANACGSGPTVRHKYRFASGVERPLRGAMRPVLPRNTAIVRPPSKSLVIPQSYQPKRFLGIAGGELPRRIGAGDALFGFRSVSRPCWSRREEFAPRKRRSRCRRPSRPAIAPAPKAKATEHKAAEHKARRAQDRPKLHKATEHKATERKEQAHKGTPAPLSLAPGTLRGAATASVPNPAGRANVTPPAPAMPPPLLRSTPALAMATSAATSPLDLDAVKQAIDLVGKSRSDEAANLESTISDPLARKLVEWLILRSDDATADFLALRRLHRRQSELAEHRRRCAGAPKRCCGRSAADPTTVLALLQDRPAAHRQGPLRAGARAARARRPRRRPSGDARRLAQRRLLRRSRSAGARHVRRPHHRRRRQGAHGWPPLCRGRRRRLARGASSRRHRSLRSPRRAPPSSTKPATPRRCSKRCRRRRSTTPAICSAASSGCAAPTRSPRPAAGCWRRRAIRRSCAIVDQWWVERRLIARKLLDLGEDKTAYEVANGAAPPPNENYRAEQQFTAGWIALRFLHEPAVALAHFARIADGVSNPITLARSGYWQGRAAEAAGHDQEARALLRQRGALSDRLLRPVGAGAARPRRSHAAARRRRRLPSAAASKSRARSRFSTPSTSATSSPPWPADLADKATDPAALAALAEIATQHNDARATLLHRQDRARPRLSVRALCVPRLRRAELSSRSGRRSSAAWSIRSCGRKARSTRKVVSSANALGLMQVTPAAGRDTREKIQRHLRSAPAAQRHRLQRPARHGRARRRSSSSIAAPTFWPSPPTTPGRGRAKEWIAQYGDPRDPKVDPIDWIERIPISETRNYVQRVLENMQVYRARFGNGSRLMIEADLRRGS